MLAVGAAKRHLYEARVFRVSWKYMGRELARTFSERDFVLLVLRTRSGAEIRPGGSLAVITKEDAASVGW